MNERSIGNLAPLPIPCTATVLQPEALRDCADVASWERVRSWRLYLYAIAGAALEVYAEKWLERAWSRGQPRVRQDNVTAANEPLSDNLRVFECVLILPTLRNRKRHDPTQGRSCAELRLQTVLAPEQLAPHRRSSWADGTAVRRALPLREEVVRPQRTVVERRVPTPFHFQYIAHRGACGKPRIVPHNAGRSQNLRKWE
jgi:hypothetical protein